MRPTVIRCPHCTILNKGSTFRQTGKMQTLVAGGTFWENGKQHVHDPNLHTASYECSEGHRWEYGWKESCWCGWPKIRPAPLAPTTPPPPPPVVVASPEDKIELVEALVEVASEETRPLRNGLVELPTRPLTRREKRALRQAVEQDEESLEEEKKES